MIEKNSEGNSCLCRSSWDEYAVNLDEILKQYRNSWYQAFFTVIQETAGQDNRVLNDSTKLPVKTVRATKAFQVLSCVKWLLILKLVDVEDFRLIVRTLLKQVAPTAVAIVFIS